MSEARPDPTGGPSPRDGPAPESEAQRRAFLRRIARRERHKLDARRRGRRGFWFGLGMFGLVGWSVAVPTLACLALGIWIDARAQSRFSWTLMLLVIGIGLGCLNAWYWIRFESRRR